MEPAPGDNLSVETNSSSGSPAVPANTPHPFRPGVLVIVSLGNPREKVWGMILALAPEGLSLSGADLASFEDIAAMVKEGEPFTPTVVFFPMHRIERVELDLSDGSLASLSHRFFAKTGLDPFAALVPSNIHHASELHHPSRSHASKERA